MDVIGVRIESEFIQLDHRAALKGVGDGRRRRNRSLCPLGVVNGTEGRDTAATVLAVDRRDGGYAVIDLNRGQERAVILRMCVVPGQLDARPVTAKGKRLLRRGQRDRWTTLRSSRSYGRQRIGSGSCGRMHPSCRQ